MDATVPGLATSFRTSHRLSGVAVPLIASLGAAAAERRRHGRPVISLAAGEPDFNTPGHVNEAAARAMASGQTKYTPGDGTRELKLAVQEKFRRENGLRYGLDQITVGTGAKQILYNAFMATLDGGDEVIVPVPAWLSYMDMVAICGGTPVRAICGAQDSFRLTPAALESAITPRTRWLVLNSPSNPTGAAYREEELRALVEVLNHVQFGTHSWSAWRDDGRFPYDGFPERPCFDRCYELIMNVGARRWRICVAWP